MSDLELAAWVGVAVVGNAFVAAGWLILFDFLVRAEVGPEWWPPETSAWDDEMFVGLCYFIWPFLMVTMFADLLRWFATTTCRVAARLVYLVRPGVGRATPTE